MGAECSYEKRVLQGVQELGVQRVVSAILAHYGLARAMELLEVACKLRALTVQDGDADPAQATALLAAANKIRETYTKSRVIRGL